MLKLILFVILFFTFFALIGFGIWTLKAVKVNFSSASLENTPKEAEEAEVVKNIPYDKFVINFGLALFILSCFYFFLAYLCLYGMIHIAGVLAIKIVIGTFAVLLFLFFFSYFS